jgi:branched-chain amino acid aminotransferase
VTPRAEYVLAGITRATVIELAERDGIAVREEDISPYRAANADEAFITSTSLCICPVRTINGRAVKEPGIPGPVTKRLVDAFCKIAAFDYVGQYLRHA